MMPRMALYVLGAVVVIPLLVVAIGYALPQGHVASVNATLPVPPHQVFERISNPARYREWRKDITALEIVGAQPPKWRERSGRDVITFEVMDSRPPERFVVRIADPDLPFGGAWTYELRPEGRGTHLTITERGEIYNPIFRVVGRFFMSPTATMERYLEALRSSF